METGRRALATRMRKHSDQKRHPRSGRGAPHMPEASDKGRLSRSTLLESRRPSCSTIVSLLFALIEFSFAAKSLLERLSHEIS